VVLLFVLCSKPSYQTTSISYSLSYPWLWLILWLINILQGLNINEKEKYKIINKYNQIIQNNLIITFNSNKGEFNSLWCWIIWNINKRMKKNKDVNNRGSAWKGEFPNIYFLVFFLFSFNPKSFIHVWDFEIMRKHYTSNKNYNGHLILLKSLIQKIIWKIKDIIFFFFNYGVHGETMDMKKTPPKQIFFSINLGN